MSSDERVRAIASDLIEWQWPDGGWNCDIRPAATHSSFHESLKPMWGLAEYARLTGDRDAARAAERAAEFFLTHRLFRSERTGEPYPKLLRLRFPAYWHYDILDALVVMTRVDRIGDERTTDALDVIEQKRRPDVLWQADGAWWRPLGASTGVDIVDWGRRGPNVFVTLNAMRVLRAAGRVRDNVAT
jgi:hypothetical protein